MQLEIEKQALGKENRQRLKGKAGNPGEKNWPN